MVEFLGLSSVLPYGFLLWLYTSSSHSKGLPVDDGRVIMPPEKRFHVRVLVPCYKVRSMHLFAFIHALYDLVCMCMCQTSFAMRWQFDVHPLHCTSPFAVILLCVLMNDNIALLSAALIFVTWCTSPNELTPQAKIE